MKLLLDHRELLPSPAIAMSSTTIPPLIDVLIPPPFVAPCSLIVVVAPPCMTRFPELEVSPGPAEVGDRPSHRSPDAVKVRNVPSILDLLEMNREGADDRLGVPPLIRVELLPRGRWRRRSTTANSHNLELEDTVVWPERRKPETSPSSRPREMEGATRVTRRATPPL
jgi:hypothetical protein